MEEGHVLQTGSEYDFDGRFAKYLPKTRKYTAKSTEDIVENVKLVETKKMPIPVGMHPVFIYFKMITDDVNGKRRYLCLFCDYEGSDHVTSLTTHIGCSEGCPGLPRKLKKQFNLLYIDHKKPSTRSMARSRTRNPTSTPPVVKSEKVDEGYENPRPSTSAASSARVLAESAAEGVSAPSSHQGTEIMSLHGATANHSDDDPGRVKDRNADLKATELKLEWKKKEAEAAEAELKYKKEESRRLGNNPI